MAAASMRAGDLRRRGVDLRRGGFDRHRLGDAPQFQRGVDAGGVVHAKPDAAARDRPEAGERDFHHVGAGRQELEAVRADLVGGHRAREAGFCLAGGDRGAGQGGAARVGDGSDNRGGRDLRSGNRRQRERHEDGEPCDTNRLSLDHSTPLVGRTSTNNPAGGPALCLDARQYSAAERLVKRSQRQIWRHNRTLLHYKRTNCRQCVL